MVLTLVTGLVAPLRAQEGPFPRAMVQPVLQQAFTAILERHLEPATPADLALWSLRGLGAVDTRLSADVLSGLLRLNLGDRLLLELLAPANPAAPGAGTPTRPPAEVLATTLTEFYAAAWNASPLLRHAGAERMIQAGFDELFNHLDPYSRYVTAQDALAARERRVGQSSLGLRLAGGPRGSVIIASVTPEGPAAQAGLREGDQLLTVDGYPVSASRITEAAELLEGYAETEVDLRIRRGNRRLHVTLRRSAQPSQTVTAQKADGLLWLRISHFSTHTTEEMSLALLDAFSESEPPRGVVLDLRGNRGGVLMQAMAVADLFLTDGPVASSQGRHPDSVRQWRASGRDQAQGRPLVILVDGRTASSAEIVTAALSDRGRAVVVGSSTLGKGLIQVVVPLSNGGEVLISWSRVLAPLGWPVQGLGIQPNLCTSLGMENAQSQLAQLLNGQAPRGAILARLRAARAPVPASEVAALRNSCPPAEGRGLDTDLAKLLLDRPSAYAAALSP